MFSSVLSVFCDVVGGDAKLASVRESSNGICHTESASKVNSASFSMDSLTAVKCVPLMHGQKVHVTSSEMRGVQPSVKRKHGRHGRPLSVRGGQRLIVKGFAFYQKCKRSQTAAPSGVADENDGDSAEAFVSSETDMSPNKVVQESPAIRAPDGISTRVVRRRNLPQETLAGESLFNIENVSVTKNCDQQEACQYDSGDRTRMTKGHMKAKLVIDENTVNARKRGRPRKVHVASEYLCDNNKQLMRNCGSDGGRVEVAVVCRRGRPRKRLCVRECKRC